MLAIIYDHSAVYQDVRNSLGILFGIIVGRHVAYCVRIENNHITAKTLTQQTAILEPEHLRRHGSHLAHRVFQSENFFLARVFAEHLGLVPKLRGCGLPGYFWLSALPSGPIDTQGTRITAFTSSSFIV